jgi:fermentation-respiration switch protein FrsA (DUF1100 family)
LKRSEAKSWVLAVTGIVVLGYLGICGYLFAEQRRLLFRPQSVWEHMPPAGSAYQTLSVAVPGVGMLTEWWIPPRSANLPTLVFFHGNGADRSDFARQGDAFHRLGWGVLLASYPGYSGNPGAPTEASLTAAARASVDAVNNHVGPVIAWGHSLGSGVAARIASEGRAAGLVLEAPYTSIVDVAADAYPYVPVRWLMRDRFDTQALLEHIKVPVLIFHSTDDPQVPFRMGQQLAEQLGERATFVRLQGAGHYPHARDLSDTVVRWAQEKHLLADPP